MEAVTLQKLTFINFRGESIEIGHYRPFYLTSWVGAGEVAAEMILTQSFKQHGRTFEDAYLEPRSITINAEIKTNNIEELYEYRQRVARVFTPLKPGILRYEYPLGVREIPAISEHVPNFPSGKDNRRETHQKCIIDLICPGALWLSAEDRVEELAVYEGGMSFPLRLPNAFAFKSPSRSKVVTNNGDVSTPPLITFNGPATAPIRIVNETLSQFIEVNQSLKEGEKLVISTAYRNKRVTKIDANGNERDANDYVHPFSKYFQLEDGNNRLSYSTGAEYERAPVTIKFKERFLGV
ncbi:phage tail family protein [Bacillus sp. HY001]|nr:phage tail family protein [Bacillus sp. HY001]